MAKRTSQRLQLQHPSANRSNGNIDSFRTGIGNIGLLLLAAFLFSAAFPNPFSSFGFWPLIFTAIIPVGVAIPRMRWWSAPLYGFFYGFITYSLFNYWLINFDPLAIFIVPVIYGAYFFVLFPLLWLAQHWFARGAFFVQVALWMGYEYFRIQFFLGYAYGIVGYALFPAPLLIQIADLGGVWLVSLLIVFPSFLVAAQITRCGWKQWYHDRRRGEWIAYGLYALSTLVYGVVSPVDYQDSKQWNVALVQQNIDPWLGGFRTYQRSLEILRRQSDRAIQEYDPDVVIWSETSFVPSISYHTRFRSDPERYELVRELTTYLERQETPFIIGNSDGVRRRGPDGELERADYNAVLVFEPFGVLQGTYRKMHLVPFTEHFPYREQLPWMYQLLRDNNTNFWEAGTEYTIFELDDVRFGANICYEDTFGYISRESVRHGAEVIVNLTNDLWSHSESAAMQHMAMAVFRAVENRRSVVRSTNGGMTSIIDPNGVILDLYPPFIEGFLVGDVPVYTGTNTIYTATGEWPGVLFSILAPLLLIGGGVKREIDTSRESIGQ